MKSLIRKQNYVVSTFLTILVLFCIFLIGFSEAEARTVKLFYFLPNDRAYDQTVVDDMKSGILSVQSFFADQMEAHGHGRMTFSIETDGNGNPVVHRVNSPYPASHYASGPSIPEVSNVHDVSSIVQLVVVDTRAGSIGGHGVDIKQRGRAVVFGGWRASTAAHELGHAFGLHHDFRDDSYVMAYGGSSSLSAGAAHFLSVNPYFNSSVPLQAGAAPSVELLSPTSYLYGVGEHVAGQPIPTLHVPITVRVHDPDGVQQVTLFVKTPEGLNLLDGFLEVVEFRNLSGETDVTVTFKYEGNTPSFGNTDLLNTLKHTVYVSAVDRQGNRIDSPPSWTLQATDIPKLNVPLSERSPRVAESIYGVVSRFIDRNVSSYDDIVEPHLVQIADLFINHIRASDSPLQSNDFDGLTGVTRMILRFESGYSDSTLPPAGIFEGLTSLSSLQMTYYTDTYGDDPSLLPILLFPVGLKKVGTGQFKAVVHTGAPSDMELPLIVVNGSITGGATSVKIPVGHVESDVLTVTRTPGTTAAVTLDVGTFPSLPSRHSGYILVKSADLPLTLNINNAPIFTDGVSTTRSVAENTPANTNIGTAIAATDADSGDTLTYTLGGADAAAFSIVSTTGQLKTQAALDYETKTSYLVTVSVSDGNAGTDSIIVIINITDMNEIDPPFSDRTPQVRDAIVAAVSATDSDNDTLTYSLGGTDAASFSIDTSTGQLQTKAGDFTATRKMLIRK
ncbi:hypothetical protein F4X73_13325 [Candidatus Poribacteria bacterium]|nr:hypothetical protein [Candidatus Poribacteria bacterium]